MSRVAVIGGGAAGMLAAIAAAEHGHQVQLFEKNEKLGKKIYITGKGRCNVTNACDTEELFAAAHNPKFLYSSFLQLYKPGYDGTGGKKRLPPENRTGRTGISCFR